MILTRQRQWRSQPRISPRNTRSTRDQTDEFALRSQKLCADANAAGRFKDEIAPFTDRKIAKEIRSSLEQDEHPKPETTIEILAKLKPVFKKDGMVTAGNASGIVDGAAALVVATESEAKRRGATRSDEWSHTESPAVIPRSWASDPLLPLARALKRAGMKLDQMDLIEVNEAFAQQALAVEKELGISREIFNVNGGAVAIGHPLAASGTRITQSDAV